MSIIVDTLAEQIRDSVKEAGATREDWQAAMNQAFSNTPLDVWLKFDSEDDDAPTYEANTYHIEDDRYRIEWYHVDVGQVSTKEFDTYTHAIAWYATNGFEDYTS